MAEPPAVLIEDCVMVPPLSLAEFTLEVDKFSKAGIKNDWEAAFLVQTEQWMSQTIAFSSCNLKNQSLRGWLDEQRELGNNYEHNRGDTIRVRR